MNRNVIAGICTHRRLVDVMKLSKATVGTVVAATGSISVVKTWLMHLMRSSVQAFARRAAAEAATFEVVEESAFEVMRDYPAQ